MSSQDAGFLSAAMSASRLSEPSWVRNGSAKVQQEYALGLEFEQMLVEQLTTSMKAGGEAEGSEGEESSGSGAGSVLSSMIPTALAEGVVDGGGLGLAAQLAGEMQGGVGTQSGQPANAVTHNSAAGSVGADGGVEADITGGAHA